MTKPPKNKRKKVIKEENIVKIKLVASFRFAYWENAVDASVAMAKAGRFVNIIKGSGEFRVEIYERT